MGIARDRHQAIDRRRYTLEMGGHRPAYVAVGSPFGAHRLVYRADDKEVKVIRGRYHYSD